MKVNEYIQVNIEDLDFEGSGIARYNGKTVFIKGALENERVEAKIVRVKKNIAFGVVTKILEPSVKRVHPSCNHFNDCGGCDIMHLDYKEQLIFKKTIVDHTFKKISNIIVDSNPTIGMKNPYQYRNKVQIPFKKINNKLIAGFYKKGSHDIVEINSCEVQCEESNELFHKIKNSISKENISIYNEETTKGYLRHLILRKSDLNNTFMVIFVINSENISYLHDVVNRVKNFNNVCSIYANINTQNTNVILGKEDILLHGKEFIVDSILNKEFIISPRSFFQINNVQTNKLYNEVLRLGQFNKEDTIIDAYSGIGSILLTVANHVKKAYGIEVVTPSHENSLENAQVNNISNVEIINGKCEEKINEVCKKDNITKVIVDPPRKGCDITFLNTIIDNKIIKLLYVSCNVKSLARDAKILIDNGYKLTEIGSVDMFPHTHHIECIASFDKVNK